VLSTQRIVDAIVDLLDGRSAGSSICPSDAARRLAAGEEEWRALMPRVRKVAAALARQGVIRITRGVTALAPEQVDEGPIRLRRGPAWSSRRQADDRGR
jgi:hypothetical protein